MHTCMLAYMYAYIHTCLHNEPSGETIRRVVKDMF